MMMGLEKRISEGFLILNVRDSERTTAEEVRMTQLELEQSLGGLFSLLTVEFLIPYLDRTLLVLQRSNEIPKLPKEYVRPRIVAGVNQLGRGQDAQALTQFMGTVAQTLGPEAILRYVNPGEAIKRLAASQGIDVLNLVKTEEQLKQEMQQQQQMQSQQELVKQAGQFASTPMMDPSKDPEASDRIGAVTQALTPPQE